MLKGLFGNDTCTWILILVIVYLLVANKSDCVAYEEADAGFGFGCGR
ncbi:MAG: hypothetical protein LBS74_01950 [Oscillospiraceae bacterium]|jgi:hypothetical protein|nr:hypothetical protein [Oscillospiraceae bacterium]